MATSIAKIDTTRLVGRLRLALLALAASLSTACPTAPGGDADTLPGVEDSSDSDLASDVAVDRGIEPDIPSIDVPADPIGDLPDDGAPSDPDVTEVPDSLGTPDGDAAQEPDRIEGDAADAPDEADVDGARDGGDAADATLADAPDLDASDVPDLLDEPDLLGDPDLFDLGDERDLSDLLDLALYDAEDAGWIADADVGDAPDVPRHPDLDALGDAELDQSADSDHRTDDPDGTTTDADRGDAADLDAFDEVDVSGVADADTSEGPDGLTGPDAADADVSDGPEVLCQDRDESIDIDENGVPDCLENRLLDGEFDSPEAVARWKDFLAVSLSYSTADQGDDASSGSLRIDNMCPLEPFCQRGATSPCFNLAGETHYDVFVAVRAAGDTATLRGSLHLSYSEHLDCAIPFRAVPGGPFFGVTRDWYVVGTSGELPAEARSVAVVVSTTNENAAPITAEVDNVLLRLYDLDEVGCGSEVNDVDIDANGIADRAESAVFGGEFDCDAELEHWQPGLDVRISLDDDSSADPDSGSMRVDNDCDSPSACYRGASFGCVPLVDGAVIDTFVQYRSAARLAGVALTAHFWGHPSCTTGFIASRRALLPASTGWSVGSLTDVGVAGAQAVSFSLDVGNRPSRPGGFALFDNFFVRVE